MSRDYGATAKRTSQPLAREHAKKLDKMRNSTMTALVVATLLIAAAINFFLAQSSYLIAAPYAVPILVATWRWGPTIVAVVGLSSILLYIATTYSGATPVGPWPISVSSLVVVAGVAIMLSRQRSETLQNADEAAFVSEQLRRSNERLTLLSEMTSQLLLSETPHAIVSQIFERISRHLDLEVYFHYVVDADSQSLRLESYSGVPKNFAHQIERLEFGQAICGYVAQTREYLSIEDIQTSSDPRSDFLRSAGIAAYVSYPLVAHDHLTGTLSFGTRNRSTFAPAELLLMHTVADQVAMALERSRLTQELQKQAQTQQFLAESSAIVTSSLDYETTLQSVVRLAVPTMADWCMIDEIGQESIGANRRRIRRVAAAHSDPAREAQLYELSRLYPIDLDGTHPIARALRTGQPVLLPDLPDSLIESISEGPDRLRIHRELGPRSTMVVPMTAHGRALGVISFVSAQSGRYGPADLLLGQEIARRAASAVDNARLYRELQESVRARTEFFSSLSHDLKNPLTTIKGVAQLLRRQVMKSEYTLDARLESGLMSIDVTATKMAILINELVDLAHLQVGDPLELDCQPTNLVSLASQIVEEHRQSTDDHVIEFGAMVPELTGLWDHSRLERVLANLMSNAIKYSPKGSVVTVKVFREATAEGPQAVLIVRDQGIGIPETDLPHIFRGFHRAANVVGRVQGTGIGLASARRIIEQHGGRITVESQEGSGSTFTVWLPLRGSGCGEVG